MAQGGHSLLTGIPLLLLYNFVFVLPLAAIITMVYYGFGVKRLEGWKQEHRGMMRLMIGLALGAVGIWIMTAVLDYLLVPLAIGVIGCIGLFAFLKYAVGVGKETDPVPQ